MTPDQERRLAAKCSNEWLKLFATPLNATALAVFGTAYIIPAIQQSVVAAVAGSLALTLAGDPHTSAGTGSLQDAQERGMNVNPQILLMAGVMAVFFGVIFLWLRHNVRKFDEKYGHTYTRPPGE